MTGDEVDIQNVNIIAPGSRSGFAFPSRIRIWIQESQINADPGPKHCTQLSIIFVCLIFVG
jgi:hypothetical protein